MRIVSRDTRWRHRHAAWLIGPESFSSAHAVCKHARATGFARYRMLGELQQQRLPRVTAVRMTDPLIAQRVLGRLFPEFDAPRTWHHAATYYLTDVEIEAGLRVLTVCQVGDARDVLFSRMYHRALLDTACGIEYRRLLQEGLHVSLEGAGILAERLADITHLISERNYVRVHLRDGSSIRIRGVMNRLWSSLGSESFTRLGRGVIVNLRAVERVQRMARDLSLVTLCGATRPVRLGRRATVQLQQLLSQRESSRVSDPG